MSHGLIQQADYHYNHPDQSNQSSFEDPFTISPDTCRVTIGHIMESKHKVGVDEARGYFF